MFTENFIFIFYYICNLKGTAGLHFYFLTMEKNTTFQLKKTNSHIYVHFQGNLSKLLLIKYFIGGLL